MSNTSGKRSITISFRVSIGDYNQIEKHAINDGVSPGAWAKQKALISLNKLDSAMFSNINQVLLEEIVALRAIFITLLSEKSLSTDKVKMVTAKADEAKYRLSEQTLYNRLTKSLKEQK